MAHHPILVIQLIIGAGILCAGQETVHFVLVQIDQAIITLVLLIIYIIDTAVTI